jgi:NAD(P)-dependent dehydrogenase (short-subunit alcohol dehydrogenase family)
MTVETVAITGAAAGAGRAAAQAFARQGARIALLARGLDDLNAAAAEVEAAGGTALVLPTDVADADAVEAAADAVERRFGPLDIWVNCAMATVFAEVWQIAPEEFRRATEVTYLGYVYGTMAALRRMRPRNHGTIVQVGSALAYRAIPLQSAYCGAKFAIRGFTDSLRSELLHEKSRVHLTMVQMPALNTPQFDWARNKTGRRPQPVPPIFQPEVAAEAILYAAHARRRELYVSWSNWKVILANKIAPGLLDRLLAGIGYSGQLTAEPEAAGRPDNLFGALPGDHGARGRFGARARGSSSELWLSRNRSWLAALGVGLAGIAGGALLGRGLPARALPARAGGD